MFKIIVLLLIIIVLIGAFFKFCIIEVPSNEVYITERLKVPRYKVIKRLLKTAIVKNDVSDNEDIVEDSFDETEAEAEVEVEDDEDEDDDAKVEEDKNRTFLPFKLKKPQRKKKRRMYFGSFSRLVIMLPRVDSIKKKVTLADIDHDVIKVKATTRDDIDMILDTYVVYRVFDPISFTYEIQNFEVILEQFSKNAVLNRIGKMFMQDVIDSVEELNKDLAENLNQIMNTQKYGFQVVSFIVQDRIPPNSIKEAMEKKRKEELDGKAAETKAMYEKRVSALNNERNIEKAKAEAEQTRITAEAKVYEEGLLISKYVENGLGELYVKEQMAKALANGNATVIAGSEATFGLLNSVSQKDQNAIKVAVASESSGTET